MSWTPFSTTDKIMLPNVFALNRGPLCFTICHSVLVSITGQSRRAAAPWRFMVQRGWVQSIQRQHHHHTHCSTLRDWADGSGPFSMYTMVSKYSMYCIHHFPSSWSGMFGHVLRPSRQDDVLYVWFIHTHHRIHLVNRVFLFQGVKWPSWDYFPGIKWKRSSSWCQMCGI